MYKLKKSKTKVSNTNINDASEKYDFVYDNIVSNSPAVYLFLTKEDVLDACTNDEFYNVYKQLFAEEDSKTVSNPKKYDLIDVNQRPQISKAIELLTKMAHNMGLKFGKAGGEKVKGKDGKIHIEDEEYLIWTGKPCDYKGGAIYNRHVTQYKTYVNALHLELIDFNSSVDYYETYEEPDYYNYDNEAIEGENGTGYEVNTNAYESDLKFDSAKRKRCGDSRPMKFTFADGTSIEVLDSEGKGYKEVRKEVISAYKDFKAQK